VRRKPPPEMLAKLAVVGAGLALVGLLPLVLSGFRATQFAIVAVYFLAITGLNVLTGYTGQISLGHGAFMLVGGYTTAILAGTYHIRYFWTIPLGALIAGLAGLAVGVPALRLSGLYLALATFGIAVAAPAAATHFKGFTGGNTGKTFPLVGAPSRTGLSANDWLYYLCWGCAILGLGVAWLLLRGRIGRAFRAIRDSEVAAASSGVNLAVYKTVAFGISAAFAGAAGALFAIANLSYVSPDTFPIKLSIFLIVGAVVSGLGSLWGIAFGAALIEFLYSGDIEHWLGVPKSVPPDVFFGGVLVLVLLALPWGIAGLPRTVAAPLGRLYTRKTPEQGASE
jgi:branched-chain amino acid transport system permease protein